MAVKNENYVFTLFLIFTIGTGCSNLELVSPAIKFSSHADKKIVSPAILRVELVATIGSEGNGSGQFSQPIGLAINRHQNRLYVADSGNDRVQILQLDGEFVAEFGQSGWRSYQFDTPSDLAISFDRNTTIYVADFGNDRIHSYNLVSGKFQELATSSSSEELKLDRPTAIATGRNGELYIVDQGNNRILKVYDEIFTENRRRYFENIIGNFREPTDLVIDRDGNFYISDSGNGSIKKYDFSGNFVATWDKNLEEPYRLAIDKWSRIYVTDRVSKGVKIFDSEGNLQTEFGKNELENPLGIATDDEGQVFVSDGGDANNIKIFKLRSVR